MTASNENAPQPLPLEYRAYVPPEKEDDVFFLADTGLHVRGTLSMMASATEDPDEFAEEVTISTRPSRRGGYWLHGLLDRPMVADYLDTEVPKSEYTITRGKAATVHEPVDLSAEEFNRHMEEKRARNAV